MSSVLSSQELLQQIQASKCRLVMAASGGGSSMISNLIQSPGWSATLLEALLPHSSTALDVLLGASGDHRSSAAATSRALAMAAFTRGLNWIAANGISMTNSNGHVSSTDILGVGLVVEFDSDTKQPPASDPHADARGTQRIHLTLQSSRVTRCVHEVLSDAGSPEQQECGLASFVLAEIARHVGGAVQESEMPADDGSTNDRAPVQRTDDRNTNARQQVHRADDQSTNARQHVQRTACRSTNAREQVQAAPAWQELMLQQRDVVAMQGGEVTNPAPPRAVFPGAFNPLHEGHRAMCKVAEELLGEPAAFEISVENVDKPLLDYLSLSERLAGFCHEDTVWLTRAPRFAQKATLFPGCTFIVGADTIVRVGDASYYQSEVQRHQAVTQIGSLGCRFLVFGRKRGDTFQTLDELNIPADLRAICDGVSARNFREDISSTEVRNQRSTSSPTA